MKKTKKNEKEVDIRPYIYDMYLEENRIFLKLAAGSVKNTKPELVMEAFFAFLGQEFDNFKFTIRRAEVYADKGTCLLYTSNVRYSSVSFKKGIKVVVSVGCGPIVSHTMYSAVSYTHLDVYKRQI